LLRVGISAISAISAVRIGEQPGPSG